MKLQLDAFLIKRYYSKLDVKMQEKLMELLKHRLNYVTKMMDLNFERQNAKYDRVIKFMSRLSVITCQRIGQFE